MRWSGAGFIGGLRRTPKKWCARLRQRQRGGPLNSIVRRQLEIREIRPSELEETRQILLAEPRWDHRFRDAEEFRVLVERSQKALVAVDGGRVIGFARALCDGISNGYLALLIVDREHRGRGVGRALVNAVIGGNRRITWVLRADPGVSSFYERVGFTQSKVAMERPREQPIDA